MKRIYFTLCLCGLVSVSMLAQVAPRWTSVYQGVGDNSDRFNRVIPDGAGNFIGVGYTIKKGNYKDILVVKFDAAGDTMWWRTKNGKGNGDDEAFGAGVDATGNVYVAGTVDAGNPQDNIITMKFDAAGVAQWDTTWDSPVSLDDAAVDLKVDGNGNCIVSGNTKPDTLSGNRDIVVLKYAPNGGLAWDRIWDRGTPGGKDEVAAIAIDNNNQIYVAGRSMGSSDDFILLQVDNATGVVNWQMPYNGGGEDRGTAVAVDANGDIIITGSSDNGSNLDFRINKYNNAGLLQWTRSLSAPASGDEKPVAIVTDASNNIYVTGSADVASGSTINLDFQTVKYNSGGTLQWVRRDGSPFMQEDSPVDLTLDPSGNVYVTGKSDQNPLTTNADFDFMTIAITPAGSLGWGPFYHSGSRTGDDDIPSSVIYDNGNVYVGGGAVNNVTQKDASVVKYDAAAGNVIWVRDYNGNGDFGDDAKAIVVDANNISYVAGSVFVESKNLNACIAKIDNAGNVLCTYQYNGIKNDDDEFKCIALSSNGMIYAAGYTKVTGQKSDMLLMKWNPNSCDTSNVGWTRTYDFVKQSDKIEGMILDNAGNIYVTGRSDADPNDTIDNNDVLTIKYDSNGNVQWVSRYDDAVAHMRDEPIKIMFDKVGDIVIGGRTENIHDDDFLVLKYNPVDGLMRPGFPARYGGPFSNDDRITDIAIDASNNIFVAGYSQTGSGNATQDPTLIAFDANGNSIPSVFYIYSALAKDEFTKIGFDAAGYLYVFNKYGDGSGPFINYDYVLLKLDSAMNLVWDRRYDDSIHHDDVPADMTITPGADIYITGTSDNDSSLTGINKNWVTLGYDSAGNQLFYANADGPNLTDDSPNQIIIRGTTIWVCGYTEGLNNNQKDLTVISYDIPLGVSSNELEVNSSVAYPNPFSENCRISVIANGEKKFFQLYDMLGNKVSEKLEITGDILNFNRGNLSRGIYQYRISSATSMLSTGKLIIN